MQPACDQKVMFLTDLEEQAAGMGKQRRGDARGSLVRAYGIVVCRR